MLTYFLCWFPMLVVAILNGSARDLWYKKYTGELTGHQISTFTLIVLFGVYIWFIIHKFPPESFNQTIYIGIMWLLLTLAFEFGFGLYRGKTFDELLADYNILKGRIWILIPIWITIAPYLFFKLTK